MDKEEDKTNGQQITSLQERLVDNEQQAEESKEETIRKNKYNDESWVLEGYDDKDEKVSFEDIEDLHEDILDERKIEETEDDERESAQASNCCCLWRVKKPQLPQNEWLKHFKLLVKNSRFIKNSWSGGLFALINNRFSAYSSTESEQKELHMNAFTQVELLKQQRLSDEQENNNQPEKNIKKILANSVIIEEEVDSLRHSQISCENMEEREILKKIILKGDQGQTTKSNNNSYICSNYTNNIANYEDYVINSSKENNNEQQDTDAVPAVSNAAHFVEDSSKIIKQSEGSRSKLANADQSTQNILGNNEFRNSISQQQQSRQIVSSVEGKRQLSNEQLPSIRNGSNPQSGSTSRKVSQMSGERCQDSLDNFNESALSNGSDSQNQISKISARKKIGRSIEVVSKPMYLKNNLKPNRNGLKQGIMKKNNAILSANELTAVIGMRCNTLLEESESLKSKDWELYEAAVYYKTITCVIEEHLKESNNFEIERPLRVIRDNFLEFYINQYGGQLQKLTKRQVAASVRDLKEFVTLFLEVIREYYALDALAMNFKNADCFLTTDNLVNFICSILFQDDLLYSVVYAAHSHFDKAISLSFFQSSKELEPYLHLSQLGVKEHYCLDETTLLKVLHSQQGNQNQNPSPVESSLNTFQKSDITSQTDQSFFSSTSSQTIYKKSMKAAQKELEEKYNIPTNQLKQFSCPYQKAINHLKTIAFHRSPVHKLKVLIKTQELVNECIKDFYEYFKLDLESIAYDADNLLSILSYILVKSKVYDIISHLKIIENFATKNTLNGSAGYLVVTLSCCIKFINSIDIPALLERNQLVINKKK